MERTVAICRASEMMASSTDPHDLSSQIIEHLHRRLDYQRIGVLLRLPGQPAPRVFARCSAGMSFEHHLREIDHINQIMQSPKMGVITSVLKNQHPIIVHDVTTREEYHAADANVRSETCFPLIVDGNCFGAVDVEHQQTGHFGWDDFTVLSAISSQLAQLLYRQIAKVEEILSGPPDMAVPKGPLPA